MQVREVDERDATWESLDVDYRVVVVSDGGLRHMTYDLTGGTAADAESWARANSTHGRFALAAKVTRSKGEVGLIWLTPPPETLSGS